MKNGESGRIYRKTERLENGIFIVRASIERRELYGNITYRFALLSRRVTETKIKSMLCLEGGRDRRRDIVPDDYFCPGCGNYSQKEPGSCPLCRTPLATLGDEASSVNDYALENDDLFEDDPGTRNSVAVHGQPRLHDKKDSFEDEDQDL